MSSEPRTKSFPIWTSYRLSMPIANAWSSITKVLDLKWSTLNTAKISFYVTAEVWPSWADFYVNGSNIRQFDFRLGGGTIPGEIDINVEQGRNTFVFKSNKESWVGWGDYVVTANLVLDGVFEDPKPPLPWPLEEWWFPYAVGGGVLTGALVYALRKRQPRIAQYKRRNS